MKLSREHIVWAYRLFLDREPENEEIIDHALRGLTSVKELRRQFVGSPEFRSQVEIVGSFDATNVVIKEIGEGLRLFVDLADTHIGRNIVDERYEPAERRFIEETLKAGDVAVDLGANIGFFSILMAAAVGQSGHVYAFEPLPRNADLLDRSRRENGFQERITLHRAAATERSGQTLLVSPLVTNNWGTSYLSPAGSEPPAEHEGRPVAGVALRDYPFRRRVNFIKIDVEGAELLALNGADAILTEHRPTVLTELNPERLAAVSHGSATDVISYMRRLDYRCRTLWPDGGLADEISHYIGEAVTNVVFEPRPDADRVANAKQP